MCLLLIFAPREKVKGIMSTILDNSELVRSLIKATSLNCSCFFSDDNDDFPHSPGTWGRTFTGEIAQLPGSYQHRLPMLREQTANYPSCRHLHSTGGRAEAKAGRWREFQGKSRACKGCVYPSCCPRAPKAFSTTQRASGEGEGLG
jgi:hypothetical protein